MQCNGFFERRVWERVLRNHCSVGKSFDPARPKKLKSGNIFNKEGLVRDENVMESRNDGGVDDILIFLTWTEEISTVSCD